MKMDLLKQLREQAAGVSKRIVYPEALDSRILRAARKMADTRMAVPVLVGLPDAVAETAETQGVSLSGIEIVNHDSGAVDRYASILLPEWRAKGVTEVEARARLRNPIYFAGAMVRAGDADGRGSGRGATGRGGPSVAARAPPTLRAPRCIAVEARCRNRRPCTAP